MYVRLCILFVVGSLKTEYKHDAAMVTADMDLGLTALNATAVMGHKAELQRRFFEDIWGGPLILDP